MFQTNIHIFLQQFDNEIWTEFMLIVSELGRRKSYMFLILFFMFGVEYRRGFIAFQALLWTISVTTWLKHLINYPRPYHVNTDLNLIDFVENKIRLENAEAPTFFSRIPDTTLAQIRAVDGISNGFPSGHTSISLSFWGSIALVFQKNWLKVFAGVFVLLTITSRMFLGQHFLADILAGLFLGSIPLFFIARWMRQKKDFTSWKSFRITKKGRLYFFLLAPLLLAFMPKAHPETIGLLFGLNFGVWFSCKNGFPDSRATWWKRILRSLIAAVTFVAFYYVFKKILPEGEQFVLTIFKLFHHSGFYNYIFEYHLLEAQIVQWKVEYQS